MDSSTRTSDVVLDFLGDFRNICARVLAALGVDVTSTDDVIYAYYSNIRRRVDVRPYRIIEAADLSCPPGVAAGYEQLKAELRQGDDVTARLSKTTSDGVFEDLMLNDWGVIHFHLGVRTSTGAVPRTGQLVFAIIRDDTVYCVGIFDHKSWAKSRVLQVVQRNWPELMEHARAKGVTAFESDHTDQEHEMLRGYGIMTLRSVGNTAYGAIGGGYTAARTSMVAHKQADRAQIDIAFYENYVRDNVAAILGEIGKTGRQSGDPPMFRFWIDADGKACATEPTAKAHLVLGPFPRR